MADAQPVDEGSRRYVGVEVRNGDSAAERCEVGGDRQARQRNHQRDEARKDQHADRIEPDHGQRIDLLAHLHRADLGGDRAARAAGDHDRGQQHAHLAQHQDADQVDDENLGAEIAKLVGALLRHDRADDGRHQNHDGKRADAHPVDLVDDRRDVHAVAAASLHLGAADRRAEDVHGGLGVSGHHVHVASKPFQKAQQDIGTRFGRRIAVAKRGFLNRAKQDPRPPRGRPTRPVARRGRAWPRAGARSARRRLCRSCRRPKDRRASF